MIEKVFESNGYKCVVVITPMGHRCGYVGVNASHPLYLVLYDEEIHKGLTLESEINVHGGLTFSGNRLIDLMNVDDTLWYFGFDCAHCCDIPDFDAALNTFKDNDIIVRRLKFNKSLWEEHKTGEAIRTLEYVEKECIKLAEQLIMY